jgi:hypothetical protein
MWNVGKAVDHAFLIALERSKSDMHATANDENRYRQRLLEAHGFEIEVQDGDGNCLFRSFSQQVYGVADHHELVRLKCIDYVESQAGYFKDFIETKSEGEPKESVADYCERMRQLGEWGGEIEIRAMCEIYGRPVEIYACDVTSTMPTHVYSQGRRERPIRLSYHSKSHYNAIVDLSAPKQAALEPGVTENNFLHAVRASMADDANSKARTSAKKTPSRPISHLGKSRRLVHLKEKLEPQFLALANESDEGRKARECTQANIKTAKRQRPEANSYDGDGGGNMQGRHGPPKRRGVGRSDTGSTDNSYISSSSSSISRGGRNRNSANDSAVSNPTPEAAIVYIIID